MVAMTVSYTRDERVTLLAVADRVELTALADELLATFEAPVVTAAPEVGVVVFQVREPVCGDRFQLGEVVVTRAEVEWRGETGWSMRMGVDREAALSAALCEAAALIDPDAAFAVAALCARTEDRRARAAATEWSDLAPTRVVFEELA